MQTILPHDALRHKRIRLKPSLKMFFACEDKASFLRACTIRRQVQSVCGDEIDIISVFWNFALLRHEGLQEWAVSEAASSEMIIVSLRGGNELPTHVKSWAERLPARGEDGQAALVALLGGRKQIWPGPREDIAFLRAIAENRGLDFFCNERGGREIGRLPAEENFAETLLRNN